VILRPFDSERDYPQVAAVLSAAYPSYPFTPDALKKRDEREPAHCLARRWVAEESGKLVGVGGFFQRSDMHTPGRFFAMVYVLPERQGQGVGQKLFAVILEALTALGATELRSFCAETDPRSLGFLAARGFAETMRDGPAMLTLSSFDSALWPLEPPSGVQILSYEQLQSRPDFVESLCALHNAIMEDVPPIGVRSPVAPEDFAHQFLDPSEKHFAGSFAAVDRTTDALIGCSELRRPPDGAIDAAWIGLTGVRREWRGRGVALALKLSAMRWAEEAGYAFLRTGNASDNLPILTLNDRLGFVREPWRVLFVRSL
jgi:mycothiol synthase